MIRKIFHKAIDVSEEVGKDHVGAYAAQSAYFFMLCMIPIILLLLTLVQFTPVTKADVMTAVVQVFPSSVDSLIVSIVNQVYNQSMGIICDGAGGSVVGGQGRAGHDKRTELYLRLPRDAKLCLLRIRSTIYTVLFIVVILLLLVVSVFGNTLNIFITGHVKFLKPVADWLIEAAGSHHAGGDDGLFPSDLQVPSQPEGHVPQTDPGLCVHGSGLDGDFLGVLRVCGYFQRIFGYVRESDNHCVDHALAVLLYVQYPAGRRAEQADGGQDVFLISRENLDIRFSCVKMKKAIEIL